MSEDSLAFDRFLDATAPAVADIARTLRRTVEDAGAGWLRAVISSQLAVRAG